jgi:hypothetical protein
MRIHPRDHRLDPTELRNLDLDFGIVAEAPQRPAPFRWVVSRLLQ